MSKAYPCRHNGAFPDSPSQIDAFCISGSFCRKHRNKGKIIILVINSRLKIMSMFLKKLPAEKLHSSIGPVFSGAAHPNKHLLPRALLWIAALPHIVVFEFRMTAF